MTGRAHLLLVLLTLGVVGFVLHLVRSGRLRAKYAMLWTTVGAGLVVLAAFPALLDRTALEVGVLYPPAAFLMAAVAFLLVLSVHFSWELSRLEERTRTLAEEVALLRDELAQQGGGGSPSTSTTAAADSPDVGAGHEGHESHENGSSAEPDSRVTGP
ncbi:MAG TPA: DUF2304 domain-containing protein [Acidimicrobiales bacterium]|nr:DUF2304 domain-containing protein [Acidimicrobiales bacterium]